MNKCKICSIEISSNRTYCSNACKFSDPEYNASRKSDKTLDPSKKIRHKKTGKVFKDYKNHSGVLTRYSKNVLGSDLNLEDWEVFDTESPTTISCGVCGWETKDLFNRSGVFTNHVKSHNLTLEEYSIKFPEHKSLFKELQRKEFFKKEDNRVQCKECGGFFKKISNTHLKSHGLNMQFYKAKHNNPPVISEDLKKRKRKNYYDLELMSGPTYTSKAELDIVQFLKEKQVEVVAPYRKLGIEIDIFIPEHNLAIEYNGLYWHSEYHGKKYRKYHLEKTEFCESRGIHLIHIFEDEWRDQRDIVESRLLNKIGCIERKIYARNCKVKKIKSEDKNKFLQDNHLQGKDSSKFKYGLFFEDELVSVMTFSELRRALGYKSNVDNVFELSRFCSKKNTVVIGGANKLFKHFLKEQNPQEIVSYADRRWTFNNEKTLYENLGFEKVSTTQPNYWYMKRHRYREHRYKYAKYKLKKFKEYSDKLTEWENMINFGYDRIWDCGSIKFKFKL